MKLRAINQQTDLENSKLFGECFIPDDWLVNDIFSPFEFFLCQINLASIRGDKGLLPRDGYLYFFVDAYSFKKDKMIAKVRYTNCEPDAYTDFNDGYFDEDPDEFLLVDDHGEDIIFNENNNDDEIILLEIKKDFLPKELKIGTFCFKIGQNDLKNGNFNNCKLYIT